ncbi:hypothetical protein RJ55_04257 [Drechmeria coniospora]|nr:hypothetical protein RJ55_04257 [Drechmeria coniospora]
MMPRHGMTPGDPPFMVAATESTQAESASSGEEINTSMTLVSIYLFRMAAVARCLAVSSPLALGSFNVWFLSGQCANNDSTHCRLGIWTGSACLVALIWFTAVTAHLVSILSGRSRCVMHWTAHAVAGLLIAVFETVCLVYIIQHAAETRWRFIFIPGQALLVLVSWVEFMWAMFGKTWEEDYSARVRAMRMAKADERMERARHGRA